MAGPVIFVEPDSIKVSFDQTLMIAAISNANFILQTTDATPAVIPTPFQTIDLVADYDQIARTLKLYFRYPSVSPNTSYQLVTTGLRDVAGRPIPSNTLPFTTVLSDTLYTTTAPVAEPTPVQDNSIIAAPFITTNVLSAANPEFYIVSIDPDPNIVFLNDNNFNNGVVAIAFSNFPASQYINSQYFIAQRKLISRDFQLWETIPTKVSRDVYKPVVYMQFYLSNDATPIYFSSQYRYRIKVSKSVGTV